MCGGSNLSTVLLLWGIYIKKCISPVRICLQTRNGRNAPHIRVPITPKECISSATCCGISSMRKTLESKKADKSLEISAILVFSCLHLNQTLIMAGIAGFEPAKMPESKSGALPLGYIPIFSCDRYCITFSCKCQDEFSRFFYCSHFLFSPRISLQKISNLYRK